MFVERLLTDWAHWLTTLHPDQLLSVLLVLLVCDAPRYTLCAVGLTVWDAVRSVVGPPQASAEQFEYTPSVCVLLVGLNEGETIGRALESVWGSYPDLEIVVVDDGSSDEMAAIARRFAQSHAGVKVLSRPERGGKSSALNWALRQTEQDVVVAVDTDSKLGPNAIWEIVQPLADPEVAAVSATVKAWNPFTGLCTWCQAYEYRQTIFMGRLFMERLGLLSIVSGAFGAFRRDVLLRVGGWDVGPGEDGDLSLRLRRAGYRIACAQYATAATNVPADWYRLFKQRLRWDRTVVTFECRKHVDMGAIWKRGTSLSDALMLVDRWFFNVATVYMYWAYWLWLFCFQPQDPWRVLLLLWFCQMALELLQVLALQFYSDDRVQDLKLALVLPVMPFYHAFLKFTDLIAITSELLYRPSTDDNFVPQRVRASTWRW